MRNVRTFLRHGEKSQDSAKDMMDGVLKRVGFDPTVYAVFEMWDREANRLVRGCQAVALQNKKICVRTPSAVHRQELMYQKARLIKKVNQAMGKNVIKDVQFEIG